MLETKTKKIYKAKVNKIEQVSNSSHFIEIDCAMPVQVEAGQFISIYCDGLTLRRPFSVFTNDNGKIGVLFKERGKGTEYIKSLKEGDFIDIIGPLGNGFDIKSKKALLVGAGIGIAPISFLKTKLEEKGIENLLIAGFLNEFEIPSGIKADKIYTDDGSIGEQGSVLNYLGQVIAKYQPEIIYACGPYVVLKTVADMGKRFDVETQVAMEKVMACGIGVCRGCVIDVIKDGKVTNATVCKDGPVFMGSEVVWK